MRDVAGFHSTAARTGRSMQPLLHRTEAACQALDRAASSPDTSPSSSKERMPVSFRLITEVGFPAMDAAANDPCYLTLTFAPEYTRHKPAGTATPSPVTTPPDAWLPSNFRLEIDGLDCSRVIRIDAFTVKQKTVGDSIGDPRDQLKEPGQIEFPNLAITMAETAVPTWLDWFESFVVKGRNDETQEKRGALVFLSPNRLTELGRVTFYNLGIFRMAPAMAEPTADQRPRMTADLYCERMEYSMHMPSLDGVAG
jgi:hypothetical protein